MRKQAFRLQPRLALPKMPSQEQVAMMKRAAQLHAASKSEPAGCGVSVHDLQAWWDGDVHHVVVHCMLSSTRKARHTITTYVGDIGEFLGASGSIPFKAKETVERLVDDAASSTVLCEHCGADATFSVCGACQALNYLCEGLWDDTF